MGCLYPILPKNARPGCGQKIPANYYSRPPGRSRSGRFRIIVRLDPGVGGQGGQPPGGPCLVTAGVFSAVLPRRLEIPADRGPAGVNDTTHLETDAPFQGKAPGFWLVGTDHHPAQRGELCSQHHRHPAGSGIIGLGPIEGGPEICATGTALKTRIRLAHDNTLK
jgi:hypothetical protein